MGQTTAEAFSVGIENITDESGLAIVSFDDFENATDAEKDALADAWQAEAQKGEEEDVDVLEEAVRGIGAVAIISGNAITTDLGWQDRALCAQTDPESFFPEKGGSNCDAKKVCVNCSVTEQCLKYALATDQKFGIWGGKSEGERRVLKKIAV